MFKDNKMPNYHLSLVGAQPLPVYFGILINKPDKVFLLHSQETEEIAQRLKNLLNIECTLINIAEPSDYFAVKTTVKDLINQNKALFTFNISGGTKIMTLAAADVAKEYNFEYQYIDQNNLITFLNTGQKKQFTEIIPLDIYFKLFGQNIKSYSPAENIDKELFKNASFIKKHFFKLSKLFNQVRKNNYPENKGFTIEDKHFSIIWQAKDKTVNLLLKNNKLDIQCKGNHIFQIFFNSGWFELEVISILKKWKFAHKIYWNTIIERLTAKEDKNEIDIIVDTAKKLFFVECKTNVNDIKDLDKFRNVVKNYGGLGAKSILVCFCKPSGAIMEKCTDNKISVFWFHDTKNQIQKKDEELIKIFDKELTIINPI